MDRLNKKGISPKRVQREREYMETSCKEECRNVCGTADARCIPCISYTWTHQLPSYSLNVAVF